MMLQKTFALIKPDITSRGIKSKELIDEILKLIEESSFKLTVEQLNRGEEGLGVWLPLPKAQLFYADHYGKFFYQRLMEQITSGPVVPMILSGTNAIQDWRTLMGPTHLQLARATAPSSLRARFALSDTLNSFHGSDSLASARYESSLFDFSL